MLFTGRTVYVLGLDYEVKAEIPWQEAVIHLLSEKVDPVTNTAIKKMSPFMVHPTKRVRSAGGNIDMAWPLIVSLNYWVTVPPRAKVSLESRATGHQILRRDGKTCAYCGGYANTVDHVVPASRGGLWTWGNLVAACERCNQKKADRTPEEAKMKLLWTPHVNVRGYKDVQDEVWKALDGSSGFTNEGFALPPAAH